MKICHMSSVHSHKDTRIFLKECNTLVNAGHEVHFVVPHDISTKIENVHIHGITKPNSRLKRIMITTYKVYKKCIELDADVYHFHDPELIPVGLKLKRKGKKVIYDIHEDVPRAIMSKKWINPIFRKIVSYFYENFENKASRKFDYLLTATPYITKRFLEINNNTVNINNFPLLNELKYSRNKSSVKRNKVSYIGGLGPIRGGYKLLEAADSINSKISIAGNITPKQLNIEFKKHPNVELLGFIGREEVKHLLERSFVGLVTFLPEPNHINAQPNKMFEYMSASVPVICSDFPLWEKIIEKNNCGICVDPTNPKEIGKAINYLYENPEIAEEMGKNGRSAIENIYNWEQEGKKLINVYKKLS